MGVKRMRKQNKNQFFMNRTTVGSVLLCSYFLFITPVDAQTETSLKEVKFLGLPLITSKVEDVRQHLWKVGGFLQARSTVKQMNFDKFFTWSTIRDSYYVSFEYNHAGQIVKARRLYRPTSLENNNRHTPIETIDIARRLITDLGNPSSVERKGWGGSLSYRSYRWEDETMSVVVDREGSESLGNVFIEYRIKIHDRFAVEQNDQKGNNA